jgi:hypothetical protein
MHGLETLSRLNEVACLPRINHPRLAALSYSVWRLPVCNRYRTELLRSIDLYAEEFVTRPLYMPGEGWNDLEALQQVTLGDAMEKYLRRLAEADSQDS